MRVPDAAEVVVDSRLLEFWAQSEELGACGLMENAGLLGVFTAAARAAYMVGYTDALRELEEGRPGCLASEYEQEGEA